MANTTELQEPNSNEAYFRMREEIQASMAQSNAMGSNKVYVALAMVTGLTAIVALIISLVVFSNQGSTTCVVGGAANGLMAGKIVA